MLQQANLRLHWHESLVLLIPLCGHSFVAEVGNTLGDNGNRNHLNNCTIESLRLQTLSVSSICNSLVVARTA